MKNPLSIGKLVAAGLVLVVTWIPAAAEEAVDAEEVAGDRPVVHGSVEVTAEALDVPSLTIVDREEVRSTVPIGDGSEVLRDVAGADLGRMGGHGREQSTPSECGHAGPPTCRRRSRSSCFDCPSIATPTTSS